MGDYFITLPHTYLKIICLHFKYLFNSFLNILFLIKFIKYLFFKKKCKLNLYLLT